MSNPLSRKRQRYVPLSETDLKLLAGPMAQGRVVAAREDVIREGDDPRGINVILDGWACRYRRLVDGRRQNASLLLPGDACDP
ncbi:cyclic nucleotide-binding domain-containing protein (plasmid) [Methylobacterium radiotolerans]|nr:cyclic nucleotide-binding domain-containing protein [Methylobacterium radiotolerans]UIY45524.1 cyclic nucleotide-binding domain-containing protein [Methylobacterium radiotolerans]